jgi:hypothetical protein
MSCPNKIRNALVLSLVATLVSVTQARAWCVLNDSVLPLALFGDPESKSTKGKIENLKAEIKCLEQKQKETMQDDFYRYNFFGLSND